MKYQIQFHKVDTIENIHKDICNIFGKNVDIELDRGVLTIETSESISTTTISKLQEYSGVISYIPGTVTPSSESGFIYPGLAGLLALLLGVGYVILKKVVK